MSENEITKPKEKGRFPTSVLRSIRLRDARKAKGYTIDDLAKFVGVSRATINNYERGIHEPKLEMWEKLSDVLELPVPYLQGLSDSKEFAYDLIGDMKQTMDNGRQAVAQDKFLQYSAGMLYDIQKKAFADHDDTRGKNFLLNVDDLISDIHNAYLTAWTYDKENERDEALAMLSSALLRVRNELKEQFPGL